MESTDPPRPTPTREQLEVIHQGVQKRITGWEKQPIEEKWKNKWTAKWAEDIAKKPDRDIRITQRRRRGQLSNDPSVQRQPKLYREEEAAVGGGDKGKVKGKEEGAFKEEEEEEDDYLNKIL